MGQKTFREIVDEGMVKAGADHLQVEMTKELNKWLLRQSQAWAWPQLSTDMVVDLFPVLQDADTKEYYVIPNYSFPFSKVLSKKMALVDENGTKFFVNVIDRTLVKGYVDYNDAWQTRTRAQRTRNIRFIMYNGNKYGKIILDSSPTQNYRLQMSVLNMPDGYEYDSDNVPWYPNDDTMTKVVEAETLFYLNGPADRSGNDVMQVWKDMATADRVSLGSDPMQNTQMQLSSRFK